MDLDTAHHTDLADDFGDLLRTILLCHLFTLVEQGLYYAVFMHMFPFLIQFPQRITTRVTPTGCFSL